MTVPLFRIAGLHIENLRALRKVEWPKDGMGWGDRVPDMVMVGGVSGSGKTTLLEVLAATHALYLTRLTEIGCRSTQAWKPLGETPSTRLMSVIG